MKGLNVPKEGSLIKITRVTGEDKITTYDLVTKIHYCNVGDIKVPIGFYTTINCTVPLPFQGINYFYKIVNY